MSGLSLTTIGLSGGDILLNETDPFIYTISSIFRGGEFYIGDNSSNSFYSTNVGGPDVSGNVDITGGNLQIPVITSPNYYTFVLDLSMNTYVATESDIPIFDQNLETFGLLNELTFVQDSSGVYTSAGYFRGGDFYITDGSNNYYTTNTNAGDLSGNLDLSGNNLDIEPLTSPSYYTVTVDLNTMTYTITENAITVLGQTVTTSGLSPNLTFTEVSGVYTSTGYFRGGNFYITDGTNSYYTTNTNAGDLSGNLDLSGSNLDLAGVTISSYYTVIVNLNNMTYIITENDITITTVGLTPELTFTDISGVYTSTGYFRGGDFYITDGSNNYYTTNLDATLLTGTLDLSGRNLDIEPLTSASYYTVTVDLNTMSYTIAETTIIVTGQTVTTVGLITQLTFTEISGVYTSTGYFRGGDFYITDGSNNYYTTNSDATLLTGTLDLSGSNLDITSLTGSSYYTVTADLNTMSYTIAETTIIVTGQSVTTVGLTPELTFVEDLSGVYASTGYFRGGDFYITDGSNNYYTTSGETGLTGTLDLSGSNLNIDSLTSPSYYTVTLNLNTMSYTMVETDITVTGKSVTTIGLTPELTFVEDLSGVYASTGYFRGGDFYITDGSNNYYTTSGETGLTGTLDLSGSNLNISPLTSPSYYTVTVDLNAMTYNIVDTNITVTGKSVTTIGLTDELTFVEDLSGVYTSTGYFRGGEFYITDGSNNYYTTLNATLLTGTLDLSGSNLDITSLTGSSYYTLTVNLNTMSYAISETAITVTGQTITTVGLSSELTFVEDLSGVYTSIEYFRGGDFYITDGTNNYYTTNTNVGDLTGTLELSGNHLNIASLTMLSYYTVTLNLNTMSYNIVETYIPITTVGLSTGLSTELTFTAVSGVYTSRGYFRGGNFYITDGSNNYYTTNINAEALTGTLDLSGSELDITNLISPNYYTVTVDLFAMTYNIVEINISATGQTLITVGLSSEVTFVEDVSGVYTSTGYFRGGDFYITDGSNNYYTTNPDATLLTGTLDLSGSELDIISLPSPSYYTVTVDLNTMVYSIVDTTIIVTGQPVTTVGLSPALTFIEDLSGVYTSTGYFRGGDFYITDGSNNYYTTSGETVLTGTLDLSGSELNIDSLTSPGYYTVTLDLTVMTYTIVEIEISVTEKSVTTVGLSPELTFFEDVSGVYTSTGYFRGGDFYITDGTNDYYTTSGETGLTGILELSGNNLDIDVLTSPSYYTVTLDLNTMTYSIVDTTITVTGKTVTTSGLTANLTFTEVSGVYTSTGYFRGGDFYITDGTNNYYTTSGPTVLTGTLELSGNNLDITSLTSPSYYTVTVNLNAMTYTIAETDISVIGKTITTVGSSNDITLVQTSPGIYRSIFQGGDPFYITDGSYNYYAKTQSSLTGTFDLSGNNLNIPFIQSPDYYTFTCNLSNMTFNAVATIDAGLQLKIVRTDISAVDISLNETTSGIYVADLQGGSIYIENMNSPYNTYGSANQVSYTGDVIYDSMNVINIFPVLTYPFKYTLTFDLTINKYSASVTTYPRPNIPCFNRGSKILTNKGYEEIQNLRKGDLVQTSKHGFVPIDMIGYTQMEHLNRPERIKDQLYVCAKNEYPEIFEDLIITGCHSILVDDFIENQREQTAELLTRIFVTDNKYRLPACLDKRAKVYNKEGTYTIYHIALENENYYKNYGVYANGLLVETCSKRYLKEISNMKLIE